MCFSAQLPRIVLLRETLPCWRQEAAGRPRKSVGAKGPWGARMPKLPRKGRDRAPLKAHRDAGRALRRGPAIAGPRALSIAAKYILAPP